jgi:hypothetical protein
MKFSQFFFRGWFFPMCCNMTNWLGWPWDRLKINHSWMATLFILTRTQEKSMTIIIIITLQRRVRTIMNNLLQKGPRILITPSGWQIIIQMSKAQKKPVSRSLPQSSYSIVLCISLSRCTYMWWWVCVSHFIYAALYVGRGKQQNLHFERGTK